MGLVSLKLCRMKDRWFLSSKLPQISVSLKMKRLLLDIPFRNVPTLASGLDLYPIPAEDPTGTVPVSTHRCRCPFQLPSLYLHRYPSRRRFPFHLRYRLLPWVRYRCPSRFPFRLPVVCWGGASSVLVPDVDGSGVGSDGVKRRVYNTFTLRSLDYDCVNNDKYPF
jgi:hypothetical protein